MRTGRPRVPPERRFWLRIKITSTCWLWQGKPAYRAGHGSFGMGGAAPSIAAHRAAWILEHGSIPDGMQVNHHCDNPLCVNPQHLYLGTQAQNMRDRWERTGYSKTLTGWREKHGS